MADPPDKQPKFRLIVAGGSMISALTLGTAAIALLVTMKWWHKDGKSPEQEPAVFSFGRWFWVGIAMIVVVAAVIRLPRMTLSLYNDEVAGFQSFVEGKFDPKESLDVTTDGVTHFKEATWADTAWRNHTVNNHALYSILARLCYDLKQGVPGQVFEAPLRLPSLLGGLVSIAAIAYLAGLITNRPRAGIFAALFLAIHPWHVRYSTEARGYGLLFGFAALLLVFTFLALRQPGRWRWWIGFAFAQAACLWTYLGAVYLLMGVNIGLVVAIFFSGKRSNSVGSANKPCWIVATVFSAALFIAAMAPALAQIRVALAGAHSTMGKGASDLWWANVLSYLAEGMPWYDETHGLSANPAGSSVPVLFWIGAIAVLALVIPGLAGIWKRQPMAGRLILIGTPVLVVFLPWLMSVTTGSVLLNWYVNTALIFEALWMGVGLEMLAFGENAVLTLKGRLISTGLVLAVAIPMMNPLQKYRHFSKQQLKEAVKIVRQNEVYPFSNNEEGPLVGGWWTNANVYDPTMRVIYETEPFHKMIERARHEGREFYFVLGALETAKRENPAIVNTLQDPGVFELLAHLPGLEQNQFQTWVFRLRN